MEKLATRIKDWPFEKGEKVKLTWIEEPFKKNNKWMFYAYFENNKAKRKVLLDWANVHFLSINKYYTDGDLNNGETIGRENIIDIDLSGIKASYNEKPWSNLVEGVEEKTKSKTFNISKNGIRYTIPIIEVIRAVIAPNRFLLNRIVEMDTLENYFTYEIKDNTLYIYFTSEYEKKLLKPEKINHLAWIITNPNITRMFNSIGQGLWQLGELKFDFLLDKFNIKARINKKGNQITVLEIISLKRKSINVGEINIYHPSLEQTMTTNDIKKKSFISREVSDEREIDSGVDGSTNTSEEINTSLINHEYETIPKINKVKNGRTVRRDKEGENTKKYVSEDRGLRTTADSGGEELLKGLEFTNISSIKEKGELEEFIEILKLLEKKYYIRSIDIIIGELPEGRIGKRFSRLKDGITKRRYAIGKIIMLNGREYSLIEVERENKALSMLLLKSNNKVKWEWIYSKLLLQLVEESGKWSNKVIEKLEAQEVNVYRNKHVKKSVFEKANFIYEKLNYLI